MTETRGRKRYLLLSPSRELSPDERKESVRLLLERYRDLDPKKMVWVNGSLIFRTDHKSLPEMKLGLELRVGDARLVPTKASGSISKLKRAAEG